MAFKPPAPQTDPRLQAARRGALLFLVSGLLAVTQAFALLKPGGSRDLFVCLSLLDFGVAALLWRLPWGRWPERALYAVIPVALATITLFNASGVVPPYAYSAFFPVLAIWVGLSLPPSTALLSSPLVFAAYMLPYSLRQDLAGGVESAVTTVALSTLIGEVIARHVRELRRAQAESERQARVLRAISLAAQNVSALSSAQVMENVADAVRSLGFEAAALSVIDPERRTFRVGYTRGFPAAYAQGVYPLEQGITGEVWRDPRTLVIDDYARHPAAIPALEDHGFECLAATPVKVEGVVRAVLIAGQRRRFTLGEQEREALELLATHAGIALENAQSFESEQERARALAEESLRDELTGLGNRRYAERALEGLQAADGVLMIDLDHFKAVNDADGHAAGDAVLRRLGAFLRESLRGQDVAARYGGEEFVVVLPKIGADAGRVAERLLAAWRAGAPRTTMSIGWAVHRPGEGPRATLERADAALYEAKRAGRDRARGEGPPLADTG